MLLLTISYACYAFGLLFFACEFGEQSSNAFNEVVEKIYQLKWYLFANKIRQILAMIIIAAQRPVEIECFGSLSCSRETFKKVRSTKKLIKIFHKYSFNKIIFILDSKQWIFILYDTSSIWQIEFHVFVFDCHIVSPFWNMNLVVLNSMLKKLGLYSKRDGKYILIINSSCLFLWKMKGFQLSEKSPLFGRKSMESLMFFFRSP